MLRPTLVLVAVLAAPVLVAPGRAQDSRAERAAMIETVEEYTRDAPGTVEGGKLDPAVLQAMRTVPRHEFVPEDVRAQAYEDRPVPIGYSQTISQPFIVALMTDLLDLQLDDKVLEIGTGSGYQAAILSPLAGQVYSIEIVPELGATAKSALERLGYSNIEIRVADGYYGWSEAAPFDGIVVTAAASHIPPPLIEQLKTGGRMVIPIGGVFATQQLMLVVKLPDGGVTTRQLLPVQFVPFTRADGK
jgi:protein-L-isoaspartate(D-aspartate) O-methyltransferase